MKGRVPRGTAQTARHNRGTTPRDIPESTGNPCADGDGTSRHKRHTVPCAAVLRPYRGAHGTALPGQREGEQRMGIGAVEQGELVDLMEHVIHVLEEFEVDLT